MSKIYNDDEAIEKLINFISSPWWTTKTKQKIRIFDGAIPFYGPFISFIKEWTNSPGIWLDAEPDATGNLTNISLFGNPNAKDPTDFAMHKLRFTSKTKVQLVSGHLNNKVGSIRMGRYEGRVVDGITRLDKLEGYSLSGWLSKVDIQEAWRVRDDFTKKSKEFSNMVKICPGLFFNMYHTWSVYFCHKGYISVRFPIEPRIALELFSDREKDPGKLRRDSLLHWVKAHLRRKRNTYFDLTEVHKHIRGRTEFFWHGYSCVIEPDEDYINSLSSVKTCV